MKARGILLFILSAIAALAVLCMVFPEDGVTVGPVTLRFPALADILDDGKEDVESPEELMARRLAAIREARMNDYLEYFTNDPARIYLPGDDLSFFDSLFVALDSAGSRRVRIIHYGDSQIEEDRRRMKKSAAELDFNAAAKYRDEMWALQEYLKVWKDKDF